MPFVRFTRDKRGYEQFYLVQPSDHRGKSRPQLLYFFRTPPNVKVGREPFDDAARRALESQYPGLTFDWPRLLDIHIPPPDLEKWRERRRLDREAKRAAKAEEEAEALEVAATAETPLAADATELGDDDDGPFDDEPNGDGMEADVVVAASESSTDEATSESRTEGLSAPGMTEMPTGAVAGQRRRRRRRRGRRGAAGFQAGAPSQPAMPPGGTPQPAASFGPSDDDESGTPDTDKPSDDRDV